MAIQRWDPFRDLREMDDTISRLWRGFGGTPATKMGSEDWNILMDVVQKPGEILVRASLPGIKPADIEVAVEESVLTIRAERKLEDDGKEAEFLVQERPTGSFFRALRLPEAIDTDRIKSSYDNGVLVVTLPIAEQKKKKQIKINVTGA